jgi:CheY-like chemotaxis protein
MQTILILEDEPSIMRLLRHGLKQYSLIEAQSADEALQRFDENRRSIDLLITDLTVPNGSGIQVALLLRSKIRRLPVIITSGSPLGAWRKQDTADLARLGTNSVMIFQKPFRFPDLSVAVQGFIGEPVGPTKSEA